MPRAGRANSGQAGFLKLCVSDGESRPDVRSLAICRETLARHHGLADFAFAMQGLGSGAISLFGTIEQKREWLPRVASGEAIAAFAMTEPECGSDAANMATSAHARRQRMGAGRREDLHLQRRHRGFLSDLRAHRRRRGLARAFGLHRSGRCRCTVAERIEVIAPHPLARLKYDNVRIPADAIVGEPGEGFRVGMETLNLFRVTVGAAALGFARRALDEALAFATNRRLGSGTLADNAVTQAKLADMATGDRRLGAADLPRRLAAGRRRDRQPPRRGHGQAPRHRSRAAGHRRGGADARRRSA